MYNRYLIIENHPGHIVFQSENTPHFQAVFNWNHEKSELKPLEIMRVTFGQRTLLLQNEVTNFINLYEQLIPSRVAHNAGHYTPHIF